MNTEPGCYENFPIKTVILSNAVSLGIYVLGAYILGRIHIALSILYLTYCLWCEATVMRESCIHCYYYGRICGFGKGKLCARLFRQGDPQKFTQRDITWKAVLPEMLVLLLPLVGGVATLFTSFAWPIVLILVVLVALSMGGNAFVRGSFVCTHCKQRELGCPAEKLFSNKQA